ncbi:C6 finger domain-containing protein [Pochonia chlamydosporia 170]|uniref:C6 finger domain-containing protein n=1 Tax=Pochonia chlamydosporia 170 TaxID=1380566 RepID=A0A179FVZ6_METCM|nr:C6 finger domain-containing protein [Pochonia chlamydosporia 170]OAQ69169.1 C6 finger domain-containing protein [Pochonia chlamydosporia 170]
MTNSTGASSFPTRRRAWLACTTCRARKTRCDAGRPRCSLCVERNVECVYADSQQLRIDPGTKILLDRIQALEDRIFASPPAASRAEHLNGSRTAAAASPPSHQLPQRHAIPNDSEPESSIPVPLSHTANANHVLNWPHVRQLLTRIGAGSVPPPSRLHSNKGTDIFFSGQLDDQEDLPSDTLNWRLFQGQNLPRAAELLDKHRQSIQAFFEGVNVFFPLLTYAESSQQLEDVFAAEQLSGEYRRPPLTTAQYCLLLLSLCMGNLVQSGLTLVESRHDHNADVQQVSTPLADNTTTQFSDMRNELWSKAQLLLGYVLPSLTLEAAQCTMLASLYMGSQGKVAQAFSWSHTTSIKCAMLAKRYIPKHIIHLHPSPIPPKHIPSSRSQSNTGRASLLPNPESFSESFRRLYWLAFIHEGDFVSEISITPPSGIALYEEVVPYPERGVLAHDDQDPKLAPSAEFVAFQISTNAAIRRFLNRVHSMIYDTKDQLRLSHSTYVQWLLRVTEDFWAYQDDIFHNIPNFLLQSPSHLGSYSVIESPHTPGDSDAHAYGNNPWNVLRLKGRYYACQHIVHRPFVEYVLLNAEHLHDHAEKAAILNRCRLCLDGCVGFIRVFDTPVVNSMTCLFATGMATFTYILILKVVGMHEAFRDVLPQGVEEAIAMGKRNLLRFSLSIREFEWHLQLLAQLEASEL